MSMLGPLAHERFFRTAPRRLFFSAYLGIVVVAGLGLLLVGDQGPSSSPCSARPSAFAAAPCAPPATVLMLSTRCGTITGSLTALINSGGLLFGSLSHAALRPARLARPVAAQALMAILVGTACLLALVMAGQPQRSNGRLIPVCCPDHPGNLRLKDPLPPAFTAVPSEAAVALFDP